MLKKIYIWPMKMNNFMKNCLKDGLIKWDWEGVPLTLKTRNFVSSLYIIISIVSYNLVCIYFVVVVFVILCKLYSIHVMSSKPCICLKLIYRKMHLSEPSYLNFSSSVLNPFSETHKPSFQGVDIELWQTRGE